MYVPNKIVAELTELMNRAEDLTIDFNKTIFQLGKLHTEWEQWERRPGSYISVNLEDDGCCCEQLQQLKAENEELKKGILLECPQCGETYLNKIGCELYEEKQKYKQCLDEIEEICKEQNERMEYSDIDYESFDYILQIIESEN